MHGWFVFDIIALLPYDALGFCFAEDGESANTIRLLRIVRLLRLGKVLRVVKASKLVQRYFSSLLFFCTSLLLFALLCSLLCFASLLFSPLSIFLSGAWLRVES